MYIKNNVILKNSLPIAISYITLGIAFGAMFSSRGGTVYEALIISVLCFSGSAQFVALAFYQPEFSGSLMFLTLILLNIRHLFYGINFSGVEEFNSKYLFFSLTDESFAISNLYLDSQPSTRDWLKIFMLNHIYWVLGCTIGCFVLLPSFQVMESFNFILVALFITMLADKVKSMRKN